jgi:F-type H+-transporting ATPase subunit b
MWAQIWSQVALVLFLALVVYIGAPKMIGKSLDDRAAKIKAELDAAKTLRDEAQALLAEYQQKRKDAEAEAAQILAAAQREASTLAAEAKAKTEDYVARRTALSEQKIKAAETEAVNAVRAAAVDLAVAAAEKLIAAKVDAGTDATLFRNSVDEVKTRLN